MHTLPTMQRPTFGNPTPTRIGSFGIVAGLHVLVIALVWQMGGMHQVFREAAPLMVSLLAQQPERPHDKPVPPSAKPFMPDIIELPPPQVVIAQEPRPVIAAAVVTKPAEIAPAVQPVAAKTEPPRYDLDYLNNPAPSYPAHAKRLGQQGKVILRVRVSAKGLAESVEVQTSSGIESLDNAALEAVKRWRFAPAMRGDEAIEGWALIPLTFKLA